MLTISFYAAIQAGCVRAHAWLVCRCSQTSPPVQKPSTFPTSSFFCLNTCGTKTHFAVRRGVVCKLALTNTRRSTLLEGARSTCPAAPTPPTTLETTAKTDDPPNTCSSCRILHFKAPYFVMAKRYHCTECHSRFDRCRVDQAALLGVSLTTIKRSDVDEASFSFMPWDARVLPLMKAGRGAHFPAHLTARGGVDKTVLDLMRIVFNSGVRPGCWRVL